MQDSRTKIKVTIEGFGERIVDKDTDLIPLAKEYEALRPAPVVAALVKGELRELTYKLNEDAQVEFLDTTSEVGMEIYERSLIFLFIKACKDVFSDAKVIVQHSLGDGIYCEVNRNNPIDEEDVEAIEEHMRALVEKDIPIVKAQISLQEASKMFERMEQWDKVKS